MNRLIFQQRAVLKQVRRMASDALAKTTEATSAPVAAPVAPAAPANPSSGGSTFFQRFSSFLTGCGVGFGLSFYFIYQDLEESNRKFQRDIDALCAQLNKK